MNKKEEYFMTRCGLNLPTDDRKEWLSKLWKSKFNDRYDVLTLKRYEKDLHVSSYIKKERKFIFPNKRKKRGVINKFSPDAIKRFKFILRNTIDKMNFEAGLTYPKEYSTDGLVVKEHFHLLRQRLNYFGYKHIWTLEFQKRGAPHFHVLLDKEIKRKDLARMWFEIVKSEDNKHLRWGVHINPIRNKDGMSKYFASYLSKQEQKSVPVEYQNVGRFWGSSRDLLDCTIRKFYGNEEDINVLKKKLRIVRRWFDSKKREWNKNPNKKFIRKKKFTLYIRKGSSFKIPYIDLIDKDLKRLGLDPALFEK